MKIEILKFFENMEDTRKNRGKIHKLNDVTIMAILTCLAVKMLLKLIVFLIIERNILFNC